MNDELAKLRESEARAWDTARSFGKAHEELATAKEVIARLEGRRCLVCGKPERCAETPKACGFGVSALDMVKRLEKRCERLQAEVKRLRGAV